MQKKFSVFNLKENIYIYRIPDDGMTDVGSFLELKKLFLIYINLRCIKHGK